ncbi:MAG: PHP domain-containing protein [Promethearchaeota archaeon]
MNTKKIVFFISTIIYLLLIYLIFILKEIKSNLTNVYFDFFIGLLIYFIFCFIIISFSVILAIFGPKIKIKIEDWQKEENQYHPKEYDKNKWNILLNTHSHSIYSDGIMNVEELINWHLAMGFNAFFITDHNNIDCLNELKQIKQKYSNKIIVLPGIEIHSENCHLNILGIEEWKSKWIKGNTTEERIKSIVEAAHSRGALVSINHYPWSTGGAKPRISPEKHPTREQALEWGTDFIEVANWDDDISSIDWESYYFSKKHKDISPVVGTDVHEPDKNRLYGWTLVSANDFSEKSLMNTLRNHNSSKIDVLINEGGIPYPTNHKKHPLFLIFKPFYQIGNVLISLHKGGKASNLDWYAALAWIFYLFLIYLIIYVIF